ncbi:MAG: hypothetical protein KF830_14355 [Planctomycetes bacterium]|nr:hypothetical protein [Planctomycetota bacterium]
MRRLPACVRSLPLLLAVLALAPQDPKPAAAGPQDSAAAAVPHPLEGVYVLRRRLIGGVVDKQPSQGYLAVTKRHLLLCLAAPTPDPDLPLVRAAVRSWSAKDDVLSTTVRMGWYTDANGKLYVEKADTVEQRRIDLMRGGLRLRQDDNNYLEFERIE